MKRPVVPITIAFCLGLILADRFEIPFEVAFWSGAGLWILAVVLPRRIRPHLLLPLFVAAGAVSFLAATIPGHLDLRLQAGPEPRLARVRGTLAAPPEERTYDAGRAGTKTRTLARLAVDGWCENKGDWHQANGTVLVITPGPPLPGVSKGSVVEVSGVLSAPPGPVAMGMFDYRTYLARQGIYYQLRASEANDWQISKACPPGWGEKFTQWGRRCLAQGLREVDQPLLLLWSMTLGARSSLENDDYEPFIRTGTMHIFAISGLHVALIGGVLVGALRLGRVPRRLCGLVALPLIWFYTGATGWQPSAVRSAVMISVVIGGWALNRPNDLLNALCAAALLILCVDPQQLFGASFQLSFSVVLSIALLLPPLETWRDRLLQHDPLLPPDCVGMWRRMWIGPARWVTSSLSISLAAWLGAVPLTVYYFHLFNPITLVANIVIVPLSSAALYCNLLSFLFGDWLSVFTEGFNNSAWLCMWLILHLSEWMAKLRWGSTYLAAMSLPTTALYYGVLAGTATGWFWRLTRRQVLIGAGMAPLLLGALLIRSERQMPTLTVMSAQGAFALHTDAGGENFLIDTGPLQTAEKLVIPFLHARGVDKLDGIVMTHGDANHVAGAGFVAEEMRPAFVGVSTLKFRSPVYRENVALFEKEGCLRSLEPDGRMGPWRVLYPSAADKATPADAGAMVLMGEFRSRRVLVLPDLAREGQEALMRTGTDLRAEVVVSSLPSRGEPLCDGLLEMIKPSLIIVADSTFPAYNRVKSATVERLKKCGARVLCCSDTGVLELRLPAKGPVEIRTAGGEETQPAD